MNTTTMTPAAQFASDVNSAYPLVEAPDMGSSAWDCVKGSIKKEYYARSPYSSIEAYERGFVVHNFVVGSQHPCKTWAEASALRGEIAGRYKTIASGPRQW
jgi:hypothetical protein